MALTPRIAIGLGLLAASGGTGAIAAEAGEDFRLGISASGGIDDNLERVPSGGRSNSFGALGVDLVARRDGPRLDVDARADLAFTHYFANVFDDEVVGRFDGTAGWDIVRDRLKWVVQENYGQIQIDPIAALTPQNRESVNYLSTGPDLTFNLGTANFLTLGGRYSSSEYGVSDLDGERLSGSVVLGHRFSGASRLSLRADYEDFQFDNSTAYSDYDRQSILANYMTEGSRNAFSVAVGLARVGDPSGNQRGALFRINASRRLSPRLTLTAGGGSELTDASDSFRNSAPITLQAGTPVAGPNVASPATFRRDHAETSFNYSGTRTVAVISASWGDDNYAQGSLFDVERWTANFNLSRRLIPALTLSTGAVVGRSNYRSTNFTDRGVLYNLAVELRMSQKLFLRGRVEREERNATGTGTDYDDNRAIFTLRYSVTGN